MKLGRASLGAPSLWGPPTPGPRQGCQGPGVGGNYSIIQFESLGMFCTKGVGALGLGGPRPWGPSQKIILFESLGMLEIALQLAAASSLSANAHQQLRIKVLHI